MPGVAAALPSGRTLGLFLLAAFVAGIGLFPLRALLAKAGVIDRPNSRSSHSNVTVRGGGVLIVFVALCGLFASTDLLAGVTLAIGLLGLAVVSFVDDVRGISASVRLAVQAAAAANALWVLSWTASPMPPVFAIGVAWIWVIGYTNAFNFMDGINGLAGMQSLITGIGTAAVAIEAGVSPLNPAVVVAIAIAGGALGFLPHNFPRARMFMGDVGSAPVGFLLAVVAVSIALITSWWVLFWLALLHANFVLDTGVTLARRALRGERLHEAHREHFYQRLVRSGWTHTEVTLVQAGLQLVVVLSLWRATSAGWGARIQVAAGVVALWFVFFAYAELKFLRASRSSALR